MTLENRAEVNSPMSAPSATRKRGRPSLSASITPTTPAGSAAARTPRSANSPAIVRSTGRSTGRKRKAAALESAQEPASGSGLETEPEPESESGTEPEPTPVPKRRGRPPRTAGTAASARLAAKAAKKTTCGRPELSAVSIGAPIAPLVSSQKQESNQHSRRPKSQ